MDSLRTLYEQDMLSFYNEKEQIVGMLRAVNDNYQELDVAV